MMDTANGQSFEVMPGNQSVFIDAQYLKVFDTKRNVSLFSRSRATAEYDEQNSDLFTGAYLNFTTKIGWGGTVLGRIATGGAGIDVGIHYFKATQSFMIYALPSINIGKTLLYSWFSMIRWTPDLNHIWKWYTSLELFSAFGSIGQLNSVQRIRVGLDNRGYQFGTAINLDDTRSSEMDINLGIFIRKQF